jgi:hypothetical protein
MNKIKITKELIIKAREDVRKGLDFDKFQEEFLESAKKTLKPNQIKTIQNIYLHAYLIGFIEGQESL